MNRHRIHRVAKLTGLSKDVIRMWERRYGFIKPTRGENRYRNYTDDDVALLCYLKEETQKGIPIGDLAGLGREKLNEHARTVVHRPGLSELPFERLLEDLVNALSPINTSEFERRLNEAVAMLPFEEALHRILIPLEERIGQLWHEGRLDVSVEHYVTKQVQQKLFTAMNQFHMNESDSKVVVACPPGEMHEIGAQLAAYVCRTQGCHVHFLGADVPVDSIASLSRDIKADLVLLSVVMPFPGKESGRLLRQFQKKVLPICPIWAGGRGAEAMKDRFEHHQIKVIEGLNDLKQDLARFRK